MKKQEICPHLSDDIDYAVFATIRFSDDVVNSEESAITEYTKIKQLLESNYDDNYKFTLMHEKTTIRRLD